MNLNEKLEILRSWHNNFDALSYFDKESEMAQTNKNSALALITSTQVINILSNGNGNGNHAECENAICLAINGYDFELNKIRLDNVKTKIVLNILNHNIEFRMINDRYEYLCIIILPDKITYRQYDLLEAYLYKLRKEIYPILDDNLLFYYSDDYPETNDIEEILNYGKKRIDNSIIDKEDQVIIGDTLENLKSISKGK